MCNFVKTKLFSQSVITSLELKVANLEEQLEAESRERLAQQKSSRKLDKKMKELALQLDEERRHADQYKEQIEKVIMIGIKTMVSQVWRFLGKSSAKSTWCLQFFKDGQMTAGINDLAYLAMSEEVLVYNDSHPSTN